MSGALLSLSSCAWSNPDNRPVWNAFEQNVVPEGDGWFFATLPVTVPIGLGAILTDTLVAHPIQVVDDAWNDAGLVWRDESFDFEESDYTELAWLPFRAVWTPVAFTGSWLGRSLFDLPAHQPPLTAEQRAELDEQYRREVEAAQALEQQQRVAAMSEWLAIGGERSGAAPAPEAFDEVLGKPLQEALRGDAIDRRTLHVGMLQARLPEFGPYDARVGLRDADPVVRFEVLQRWRTSWPVDARLRATLRDDPVESVRLLARQLWRR
ncbi:MAG: hypothetical protein ACE37K_11015 [Planctomycetota bacterium]